MRKKFIKKSKIVKTYFSEIENGINKFQGNNIERIQTDQNEYITYFSTEGSGKYDSNKLIPFERKTNKQNLFNKIEACINIYNIACKRINNKEKKVYEINKVLATKFEEELSFKIQLSEISNKKILQPQKTEPSDENLYKNEQEGGFFKFLGCTQRKKDKKEEDSSCTVI